MTQCIRSAGQVSGRGRTLAHIIIIIIISWSLMSLRGLWTVWTVVVAAASAVVVCTRRRRPVGHNSGEESRTAAFLSLPPAGERPWMFSQTTFTAQNRTLWYARCPVSARPFARWGQRAPRSHWLRRPHPRWLRLPLPRSSSSLDTHGPLFFFSSFIVLVIILFRKLPIEVYETSVSPRSTRVYRRE